MREYPEWAVRSVHFPRPLTAGEFQAQRGWKERVSANVIGIIENQAPTRHLVFEMAVIDGEVRPDMLRDIAKVALVERHRPTGQVQVGLVHGFWIQNPLCW